MYSKFVKSYNHTCLSKDFQITFPDGERLLRAKNNKHYIVAEFPISYYVEFHQICMPFSIQWKKIK